MAKPDFIKKDELFESISGETFIEYYNGHRSLIVSETKPKYKKKELNYLSVPPGAGKTEWAVNFIVKNAKKRKERIIYCSPTIDLLNQTLERVEEQKPDTNMVVVHSQLTKDLYRDKKIFVSTTQIAKQKLELLERGDCLFLTHATLLELKSNFLAKCYLIFDEASEWTMYEKHITLDSPSIKFLNRIIKFEAFKVDPEDDENYKRLRYGIENSMFHPFYRLHLNPKVKKEVSAYQRAGGIHTNKDILEIIRHTKDESFSMYTKRIEVKYTDKTYRFSFLGFSSPKFFFNEFKQVMFLSAFFEKSPMFNLLKRHYKLKDCTDLVDARDVESIWKGYRNMEVISLFNINKNLSKYFLQSCLYVNPGFQEYFNKFIEKYAGLYKSSDSNQSSKTVKEQLVEYILSEPTKNSATDFQRRVRSRLMRKEKDLKTLDVIRHRVEHPGVHLQKMVNKDLEKRVNKDGFEIQGKPLIIANIDRNTSSKDSTNVESMFQLSKSFQWIGSKSHGINKYRDRNVFVSLASFNSSPDKISFYKFLFGDSYSPLDTHIYIVLQGVTRTQIRNPKNSGKVLVYVFSKSEAEHIKYIVGKCKVSSLKEDPSCMYKINNGTNMGTFTLEQPLLKYTDEYQKNQQEKKQTRNNKSSRETNLSYNKDEAYRSLRSDYSRIMYKLKNEQDKKEKKKLEQKKAQLLDELSKRRTLLSHKKEANAAE